MTEESLACLACAGDSRLPITAWQCPDCHGPLFWKSPASFHRNEISPGSPFIWRYGAALPDVARDVDLGGGQTGLIPLELGCGRVSAKLESLNPTASFKDRGCALLVNAFLKTGATRLVEDSSGNAASSLAGYAARAGIPCTVFAPAHASSGKLIQAAAFGADVVRVEGTRADVATAAEQAHMPEQGIVYASHNWHPWFIAGVTTWALEVWEQRGFRAPEAVIVPAGSGSLVLGAFAGFSMLLRSGEIERLPRIFAAQPAACCPLVVALEQGSADTEHFQQLPTRAEGASIAHPVRGREVLEALRASGGGAIAISEDEIVEATFIAARQGVFIEPTSALAVAAASRLIQSITVPSTEETVVVLTGSGLKAQTVISELL